MRTSLNANAFACLFFAFLLLTIPFRWLVSAILAAAFHEFCHILAIHFLGGRVLSITVGAGGAIIEHSPVSPPKALLCAFAGPLGSLILVVFCHRIPRIALCAGFQALFNLLPLFPMDGGRILRCVSEMLLPEHWAHRIYRLIEQVTLIAILFLAAICVLRFETGMFPLIFAGAAVIKGLVRKIPCKQTNLNVQ